MANVHSYISNDDCERRRISILMIFVSHTWWVKLINSESAKIWCKNVFSVLFIVVENI